MKDERRLSLIDEKEGTHAKGRLAVFSITVHGFLATSACEDAAARSMDGA
jgi:hypothetical protein